MRTFVIVWLAIIASGCGPSAQQLRARRLSAARAEAQQQVGARQAVAYAEAVQELVDAGDYRTRSQQLAADTSDAIRALDAAIPNAGVDAPLLVAWRAHMLLAAGHISEAKAEYFRSWRLGPNKRAGYVLVGYYGSRNEPQQVGAYCNAMVDLMTTTDERFELIETCRKHMNAASPEGEMAWMSAELVAWYEAEKARRLEALIAYQEQRAAQDREEQRIERREEQCVLACKERGLYCQNRCDGDLPCESRCGEINTTCVDRCEAQAKEQLGE